MKKYLLVVVALGLVVVNAESNPFELQKNLQKIDQDQEVLLSALKKMAEKKDALAEYDEPADDIEVKEEVTLHDEPKEEASSDEVEPSMPKSVSNNTSRVDVIREKVIVEELKKVETTSTSTNQDLMQKLRDTENEEVAQEVEEKRIEKVKEAQVNIEKERAAKAKLEADRAEAEAAQLAAQKIEEEKREVEAYEAERLVKKQEEDKLAAQKKDVEIAQAEATKQEEIKKQQEQEKNAIVDINVTREELTAKKDADKAYLEAIRAVN